jgi:hypothetical protein
MASKIEPRLNQHGELIKWEPSQIPSTKPFVKIVTSAYESATTDGNMQFVKTRSLIYTPFHKEARYINFEIGYLREAKWLEFINDKWTTYANFYVAGFFEGIYTAHEKGSTITHVQIEAKTIDYDARFRHLSSPSENLTTSPKSSSTNIFAQRRGKLSSEHSPYTPKRSISRNDSVTMQEETSGEANDGVEDTQEGDEKDELARSYNSITPHKKKRQLSNLCNSSEDELNESSKTNESYSEKESRGGRGRQKRGVIMIEDDIQEENDPNEKDEEDSITPKSKKRQLSNSSEDELNKSTKTNESYSEKGSRGGRGGRGGRGRGSGKGKKDAKGRK